MQQKKLSELEQDYELELDRIVKEIKKEKAKKVLIQLPDYFKPYATEIQDKLKSMLNKDEKSKVEFFIWLDTCFGACDIPIETEKLGIDMIIQFGHSSWEFK
jgi:diphthamide biosynthesis enzyme Dph1/Dph2-like protein